jgi:hypothetical protein
VADHTLTWQVTVQLVGMAQWLAATWPSHGLPRGSGKMPNEGPRTEFKKKKKMAGPPNLAEPHQIWRPTDISKPPLKLAEPPIYIYIYISYNKHPKGEARGLDPGTSPIIYALTIAPPTTRPNDLYCLQCPQFLFKN